MHAFVQFGILNQYPNMEDEANGEQLAEFLRAEFNESLNESLPVRFLFCGIFSLKVQRNETPNESHLT